MLPMLEDTTHFLLIVLVFSSANVSRLSAVATPSIGHGGASSPELFGAIVAPAYSGTSIKAERVMARISMF
jgi:hypothetical protein